MEDYSSLLGELSEVLRRLHKVLLHAESDRFGVQNEPLKLLDLAINDPSFAWLRELSELIVEIDERRDSDEPTGRAEVVTYKKAVTTLVDTGSASRPEFRKRYLEMLQDVPAAAMMHGDLRRVLDQFPETPKPDKG